VNEAEEEETESERRNWKQGAWPPSLPSLPSQPAATPSSLLFPVLTLPTALSAPPPVASSVLLNFLLPTLHSPLPLDTPHQEWPAYLERGRRGEEKPHGPTASFSTALLRLRFRRHRPVGAIEGSWRTFVRAADKRRGDVAPSTRYCSWQVGTRDVLCSAFSPFFSRFLFSSSSLALAGPLRP
jgi:hypothetical protein